MGRVSLQVPSLIVTYVWAMLFSCLSWGLFFPFVLKILCFNVSVGVSDFWCDKSTGELVIGLVGGQNCSTCLWLHIWLSLFLFSVSCRPFCHCLLLYAEPKSGSTYDWGSTNFIGNAILYTYHTYLLYAWVMLVELLATMDMSFFTVETYTRQQWSNLFWMV